jgi:hypothetical protein
VRSTKTSSSKSCALWRLEASIGNRPVGFVWADDGAPAEIARLEAEHPGETILCVGWLGEQDAGTTCPFKFAPARLSPLR